VPYTLGMSVYIVRLTNRKQDVSRSPATRWQQIDATFRLVDSMEDTEKQVG